MTQFFAISESVSEIGKVYQHNEDALYTDDKLGVWLVADGMGGHSNGAVASQLAVSTISAEIGRGLNHIEAILSAHENIAEQVEIQADKKAMGTTVVSAQIKRSGFNIAWVGDSRAYLYDGEFRQLTIDHSYVQDMVFRGVLTAEEAATNEHRNLINRSLGMTSAKLRVDNLTLFPNKPGILFLCSDGVSDFLTESELLALFSADASLKQMSEKIRAAVMETEAADNFSFIMINYELSLFNRLVNKFLSLWSKV